MKIVKIMNKDALSIPMRCLAFLAPKFIQKCILIKRTQATNGVNLHQICLIGAILHRHAALTHIIFCTKGIIF